MTTSTPTIYSEGGISLTPGHSVSLQDITGQYLLNGGNWAMSFQVLLHAADPGGQIFSIGSNSANSDLVMTYGLDNTIKINKTYQSDGAGTMSTSGLLNNDVKAYFRYKSNNSEIFLLNSFCGLEVGVWYTITMTVTRNKPNDDNIFVVIYTDGASLAPPAPQKIWDYYGSTDTSNAVLGGGVNAEFKNVMFWKDTIPTPSEVMQNQSQPPSPPPDKIYYSETDMGNRRQEALEKVEDVLKTFAPVVYLCADEPYKPMEIKDYIEKCGLWYKFGGIIPDTEIYERVKPYTMINQASYRHEPWLKKRKYSSSKKTPERTAYYLQLINKDDRESSSDLTQVPFYCFAFPGPNFCDLTYAFFYPWDGGNDGNKLGWFGSHAGDWEHIIVRIGRDDKNKFSDKSKILGAYYQVHRQSNEYSGWYYPPETQGTSSKFEWEVEGYRVKVYAARESHGSYTKAGTQHYTALFGWPDDVTCGNGLIWGKIPNLVLMTGEEPWNDYNGTFGTSPYSPKMQGWLDYNTRPGGPSGSTSVRVAPMGDASVTLEDESGAKYYSNHFKLDYRNKIKWVIESALSEDKLAGLSFDVISENGEVRKRIDSVAHQAVTEEVYSRDLFAVLNVVYQDSTGMCYGGEEAFKRLGISELILKILDFS